MVAGNEITRAGCWAHLRRKIIEAEKAAPEIARQAVEMVSALYAVEKQAKDASVPERLTLRQVQSAPVLAQLRERFLTWKEQLLPKHPMAEAINYALSQWTELAVFCSDGAVPIDNNVSEREMKRVVLNRKNSLFVGNSRGGRTAAMLASLTSTCRRHDLDPQLYLTQLLINLPSYAYKRTVRLAARSVETRSDRKTRQPAKPSSPSRVKHVVHVPLTVDRLMQTLPQLRLNGVKRGTHALRHGPTSDDEMALGILRTVVRES